MNDNIYIAAENAIKKIEGIMYPDLKSTGEQENAFNQHVGHIVNHEPEYGKMYDELFRSVERRIAGNTQERWIGQNKKTELEKAKEELAKQNMQK